MAEPRAQRELADSCAFLRTGKKMRVRPICGSLKTQTIFCSEVCFAAKVFGSRNPAPAPIPRAPRFRIKERAPAGGKTRAKRYKQPLFFHKNAKAAPGFRPPTILNRSGPRPTRPPHGKRGRNPAAQKGPRAKSQPRASLESGNN